MADIAIYQNDNAHAQNLAALLMEKSHTPHFIMNSSAAEAAIEDNDLVIIDWDAEDSHTKINVIIAEKALQAGCNVLIYTSLEGVEKQTSYKALGSQVLVVNRRDDKGAALVIMSSLATAFRSVRRVRDVNLGVLAPLFG